MADEVIDSLVEDMLSIPPLVHRTVRRKLLKVATNLREDISPPLFGIMQVLDEAGTLHIAEIGERLQIPRPQMTHLIDRLVKMGIVNRQRGSVDRRVINVLLTPNGKKVLAEFKKTVTSVMRIDLANLTGKELQDLSMSLRNMRDILSKLQ